MPIKVTCSNCGGVLHAPDDAGGKRGRCPTCGNILPIPAVGGGLPPAADAPRPARANPSPSFGEFGLPDKGTPTRSPEPAPRPVVEPRRASVPIPAATDDDRPTKRKPTSPFAKPGPTPAADPDATEATARAWRKARGGLWWVRTAAYLFLLPVLALNGLRLYEHFAGPLAFGGVLHQDWLPPWAELDLALFGVPLVLALFFLVFGRLSFSGVPRRTGARGLALFAALATLTTLGGLVAVIFPPVSALVSGVAPGAVDPTGAWQLFDKSETLGLIQRFGLTVGLAAFLVAEFWFVSALGRAATALDNPRFGGRVSRFTLLMGLAAGLLLAGGIVRPAFTPAESRLQIGPRDTPTPGFDFNRSVKRIGEEVQGVLQREGAEVLRQVGTDFAHWDAVRAGAFLLGGLLAGMMYLRMVGAGRRAIREWLEIHQPTT